MTLIKMPLITPQSYISISGFDFSHTANSFHFELRNISILSFKFITIYTYASWYLMVHRLVSNKLDHTHFYKLSSKQSVHYLVYWTGANVFSSFIFIVDMLHQFIQCCIPYLSKWPIIKHWLHNFINACPGNSLDPGLWETKVFLYPTPYITENQSIKTAYMFFPVASQSVGSIVLYLTRFYTK